MFDDPHKALEYFANKRSSIALGVTQPAQRRYYTSQFVRINDYTSCVEYFTKILQQNVIPYQVPYCLAKIVMYGVNQQRMVFHPIIKVNYFVA